MKLHTDRHDARCNKCSEYLVDFISMSGNIYLIERCRIDEGMMRWGRLKNIRLDIQSNKDREQLLSDRDMMLKVAHEMGFEWIK